MASLSFFARGDGSSANNAALNVDSKSHQATVEITFESGATGDIVLDGNCGDVDPDTTVTIDGVSYNFILEQTGDLPIGNGKVLDVFEGSQVTVISYIDLAGNYQRLFFMIDGSGTFELMDSFGNGSAALTNVDPAPTAVYICFCGGTDVLTPSGYRKVETLKVGDLVVTDTGAAVPILWCAHPWLTCAPIHPAALCALWLMQSRPVFRSRICRFQRSIAWLLRVFGPSCILLNRLSWCQRSILWGRWRRPICPAKM